VQASKATSVTTEAAADIGRSKAAGASKENSTSNSNRKRKERRDDVLSTARRTIMSKRVDDKQDRRNAGRVKKTREERDCWQFF
jgi:hypothetical protein